MSFDIIDAAFVALQHHQSAASLPHLPEAGPAEPMLDWAALAGTVSSAPTETSLAAIVAALGGDPGAPPEPQQDLESLLARLVEEPAMGDALPLARNGALDAPFGVYALDPLVTEAGWIGDEPVLADLLPPPGEEPGISVKSSTDPDGPRLTDDPPPIVVTGTRVRHYYVGSDSPSAEPVPQSDSASIDPGNVNDAPDTGTHVFVIVALGLELKIPAAECNMLNEAQKNAFLHVLDNYHKSPDLTAALQHLKNEGVEVVIRFGERSWNAITGLSYDFRPTTIAGMTADPLNDARTDLRAGSLVVISFNSNHNGSDSFDGFGSTLVHELLHPWVPNTWQLIGDKWDWVDHDRIEGPDGMEAKAWALIIGP